MHRSSPILSLVFLLFFTVSGSKAFSYTYDGKLPARILCEDTSEVHMKVCADSFTLNDTTYYRDGIHTQTFINAAGCDSTVYLYLSLKVDKPVINVDSLNLGTTSYYETYQWY